MQRLLKACSIPDNFTFDILTTIQPVIDWDKLAVYLSRTGYTVQLLGRKFQHLADQIALTPPDQKDCATINRESRKQMHTNVIRGKRIDLIMDLIETYHSTHIKQLKNLTRPYKLSIYREFGLQ